MEGFGVYGVAGDRKMIAWFVLHGDACKFAGTNYAVKSTEIGTMHDDVIPMSDKEKVASIKANTMMVSAKVVEDIRVKITLAQWLQTNPMRQYMNLYKMSFSEMAKESGIKSYRLQQLAIGTYLPEGGDYIRLGLGMDSAQLEDAWENWIEQIPD